MSRRTWAWVRLVGGVAILGILVWRLGSGPFLDGLRNVDGRSLLAATGIAMGTTMCCAWRWSVLVRGLGIGLSMRDAVASYYRSQFLNSTLPGGVLGDVHRAVRHGRAAGDLPRGARAVVWDRLTGQFVQALLTVVVLLALPSPVRSSVPAVALITVAVVVVLGLGVRALARGGATRVSAALRTIASDLRSSVFTRRAWPVIVIASVLAVVGHVLTFLVAARTAGSTTSVVVLVPLALLVLVAMGIPANVAGWGPREGVAAWVFAAAGLGAAQGVATAVVYGVMVFVASLPGAVVLVLGARRRPVHV
jgi:uncharacterized membrane protein YbhN (UPF0104 family)